MIEEVQFPDNKNVFKISEAADLLGVKPYVLRYWETEFQEARTRKSYSGQRVYHREDIERIKLIRDLLYKSKYSIAGARAVLKDHRAEPVKPAKEEPAKVMAKVKVEAVVQETVEVIPEVLEARTKTLMMLHERLVELDKRVRAFALPPIE